MPQTMRQHIAWHNAFTRVEERWISLRPHAVFTVPQIASIGLTEAQATASFEILWNKRVTAISRKAT